MELSDQELLSVYDTAKEQGHPDPIGLLARSKVLSELDNSFASKDRFGISGVRQEDVQRVGIDDASDVVSNLAAAIKIDMDNFANFKDIGNMHVAFHSGGEAVADRSKRPKKFMRELSKAKAALDKQIKAIRKQQPKAPTDRVVQNSEQQNVSVPEFSAGRTPEPLVSNAGNLNNLQRVRSNAGKAVPKKRAIPKKKVAENRKILRNIIKEALRSA